jgi:hypothetical protein
VDLIFSHYYAGIKDAKYIMGMFSFLALYKRSKRRWRISGYALSALLLCCLLVLLTACDSGAQSNHRQVLQTDSGSAISYSTRPQDVVIRLFEGGGKVGQLQFTPEASIYGDGTFILGPGLQPQEGKLTDSALQTLLHTVTSTDQLLQLSQHIFDDIPEQNVTLLQLALNGQNYRFSYGPFGHLQQSAQEMQEYGQLGNAINAIKGALLGPKVSAYTSPSMALLVYQTFRPDFTPAQNWNLPIWPISDFTLSNIAIYECGIIKTDNTGPNADNGCLVYTVPQLAYLPNAQDLQLIKQALDGKTQAMFYEDGNDYVVMLRPLLPDEIAQQQLAMYGSNIQSYAPVPLKSGVVPVPTVTPGA